MQRPPWLKPYGRVFPRITIERTGLARLTSATLSAHAAREIQMHTVAHTVATASASRSSRTKSTFSELSVESIGLSVFGYTHTHAFAINANEVEMEAGDDYETGEAGEAGDAGDVGDAAEASEEEEEPSDDEDCGCEEEWPNEPSDENRAEHIRFISRAEAHALQRERKRHVSRAGVYFYPRFESRIDEERAQKAPRRGALVPGDVLFTFAKIQMSDIQRTGLGMRVSSASTGFNARLIRTGNRLVAVATDPILTFREVIVEKTESK